MRTALASLLAAFALVSPFAQADYMIGHIGSVSSQLRDESLSSEATLDAFFAEVNKKGGINGQKVVIKHGDDGFNGAKYAEEMKRLIAEHKPLAFIGSAGSAGPLEVVKQNILTDNQLPLIAPISGAPSLRNNPNIFHVRASWADEMAKLVQQMQSLGHSRLGVFYQNDVDGKFGLFAARQEAKKVGMEIAGTGSFEKNTTEVSAAVKSLIDAAPSAIVVLGPTDACASFVKNYRKAGGTAQIYGPSVLVAKDLIAIAGLEAARGTGISQVMPFIYADATPIAKEYRAFVKRNKLNLGYIEFEYYIAARLLVAGLKKMDKKNPSGAALITALESVQNLNMGGFKLDFGPKQRVGSKFVEVTVIGQSGELIR